MRAHSSGMLAWIAALAVLFFLTSPLPSGPIHGPERGSLVICGGGRLPEEIIAEFIGRAGGPGALIVVVPTAGGRETYDEENSGLQMFRSAGAANLTFLHTYDPQIADTEAFARPLRQAGGVWFGGGRQWRLVDAYAGTGTERAFLEVLERGGVIGGSSAGASIQASYMVRGAPQGNTIMMAEGYEQGFGYLRNAAVDQHIDTRRRQADILEVLAVYPELLGIGLYEGTALVVERDMATVMGRGSAALYDIKTPRVGDEPYNWLLSAGQRFDLARRRPLTDRPD